MSKSLFKTLLVNIAIQLNHPELLYQNLIKLQVFTNEENPHVTL